MTSAQIGGWGKKPNLADKHDIKMADRKGKR